MLPLLNHHLGTCRYVPYWSWRCSEESLELNEFHWDALRLYTNWIVIHSRVFSASDPHFSTTLSSTVAFIFYWAPSSACVCLLLACCDGGHRTCTRDGPIFEKGLLVAEVRECCLLRQESEIVFDRFVPFAEIASWLLSFSRCKFLVVDFVRR